MQNLGLFVLLGRARGLRGVEGALKFFILGAVSSAFFIGGGFCLWRKWGGWFFGEQLYRLFKKLGEGVNYCRIII